MKALLKNPWFILGLSIRVALLAWVAPAPVEHWYLPFLNGSVSQLTWNPWSNWLAGGGDPAAFPYGYAMWLSFLPAILLAKLTMLPLREGYALTILATDFGILLIMGRLLPRADRLVLIGYWLSPITIVASYALGYNDLIPVLFLTAGLLALKRRSAKIAGVWWAVAASAKLSMIIALPFALIYLFRNRALRALTPQFIEGLALGALVFGVPFLLSSAALQMLVSNPEMTKVYNIQIYVGAGIYLFALPLTYALLVYYAWRIGRMNFDLFFAILGIAFLVVVLLTPASPGWFVWAVPLLLSAQTRGGRIGSVLTLAFASIYVVSVLLTQPGVFDALFPGVGLAANSHSVSLIHTAMAALGIVLALRTWREAVSRDEYFRISRKPFVIGVAGDSGAGKDTYCDALKGVFGAHSVASLSGDDYHLWDRHKPMWQVMTHLNPAANDLEAFTRDVISLVDGKPIMSRHYDHQTGKMSKPRLIRSNDVILVSGLHALYLPMLRRAYNLSVYLDIDEGLRRHFKVVRDVDIRGHALDRVTASIDRRVPDAIQFIRPQMQNADLVLSLQPIHSRTLAEFDKNHPLRYKLVVRSRSGLSEQSLVRTLVGIGGLHVDAVADGANSSVQLTVEGESTSEDIALAAKVLFPDMMEYFDLEPLWQDGILGLMQLVTIAHMNQDLMRRVI